ncbi:hypothetical protein, partial [Streptomyces sp. URMC 125]|uniref:hypothetical protein n=1 Tax=Streptomyces sp. URMC 125 TaxID=3423419 RepID=UPI003F19BB82
DDHAVAVPVPSRVRDKIAKSDWSTSGPEKYEHALRLRSPQAGPLKAADFVHARLSSMKGVLPLWGCLGSKFMYRAGSGGSTGESSAREADHREVDHGFEAVRVGLVAESQAPVVHEPAEDPLDHPAPRNDLEPL